jgi:hypothetical protein
MIDGVISRKLMAMVITIFDDLSSRDGNKEMGFSRRGEY